MMRWWIPFVSLILNIGIASSGVPAAAQNAEGASAGQSTDPNEVIVTGSHIVRPNITASAPITSVTLEEIQQSGAVNVEDLLNKLPQVQADNQQTYQDSNGAQRLKLRNQTFERTLVLIDGKRVSTNVSLDANIIPVALLDRIDILSGGASAVYGSDAIAGVINFVLKKDFTGWQINGSYGLYNHGNRDTIVTGPAESVGITPASGTSWDGGRGDYNIAWGDKFFDGKLRMQAFYDYRTANPVTIGQRDYSDCNLVQSATNGPLSCSLSTYSKYGYFSPQSGANAGNVYSNAKDGSQTFVTNNTSFGYNRYAADYLQRSDRRDNQGLFANMDVSDDVNVYASYLRSHDVSYNQFSAPEIFDGNYDISCNNPLMSAQQQKTLCGSAAGTPATMSTEVRYRAENYGASGLRDNFVNLDRRATLGMRGDVADAWHFDLSQVYGRFENVYRPGDFNPSTSNMEDSFNVVSVNGVPTCAAALSGANPGCVPANIFSAGANNSAYFNWLYAGYGGTQLEQGTLWDTNLDISGDLGRYGITSPYAQDGVALAFGTEYRKDIQHNQVDQGFVDNEGYGSDFNAAQSVKEGYIELQAPLAQHQPYAELLSLQSGYRWSKYSTNPDIFTTWKVEGSYAPVADVTLRTSYNKAQRAPTVYENSQAVNTTFTSGGADICAGANPVASLAACELTGVSAAQYGHIKQCDNDSCLSRQGGSTLAPETAHTLTFGTLLTPEFIPGLTVSADRYLILVDNSIDYEYDTFWANGCATFATPYYCSHFKRNADGSLTSYSAYQTSKNGSSGFVGFGTSNNYKSFSEGVDFQAQYGVRAAKLIQMDVGGRFDFTFNGSWTTRSGSQGYPQALPTNCAGYFGDSVCTQAIPAWSHTVRGTYTTEDNALSVSLNWRHIASLTNSANSGDAALGSISTSTVTDFARIPSYDYFDLSVGYQVNATLSLKLTINNIADSMPPIIANSYNYSLSRANTIPALYDPLGRWIQSGFSLKF